MRLFDPGDWNFYGYTEPGFVFIIRLSKDDFQFITDTVFTKTLFSSSFTIISFASKRFMLNPALILPSLAIGSGPTAGSHDE